jgi:hypothetical protein
VRVLFARHGAFAWEGDNVGLGLALVSFQTAL